MRKTRIDSQIIFLLVFPVVFLFTFGLLLGIANAANVTLAWDANTETNLAGYKLYYDGDSDNEIYQGTGATEGDSPVVIYLEDLSDKNSPTFTLTGLQEEQYYYFALTALNTEGMESDFSEEVGVMTVAADADATDSLAKTTADTAGSDESDNSDNNGAGCFISGTMSANSFSFPIPGSDILMFIIFAAMMGIGCRKR